MNKKGDLTINIIVIAVVALLVLVILIAIFSGKMGEWVKGTEKPLEQSCVGSGGSLTPFSDPCSANRVESFGPFNDLDPGYKCCLPQRN